MIWVRLYMIEDVDIYVSVSPQNMKNSKQRSCKPAEVKKKLIFQHQEGDRSTSLCSGRYSTQDDYINGIIVWNYFLQL